MTTTLNHDEFDGDGIVHNYEPYNLVYGALGWTDDFTDDQIRTLVGIGAIKLVRAHSGLGWETRIYVSVQGEGPN